MFSFNTPHLSFKPLTLNSGPPLFAFVAPAKYFKKAVVRNLLKRRGRHIIRLEGFTKSKTGGAFFFKPGANLVPFAKLRQEIVSLLEKAKMR